MQLFAIILLYLLLFESSINIESLKRVGYNYHRYRNYERSLLYQRQRQHHGTDKQHSRYNTRKEFDLNYKMRQRDISDANLRWYLSRRNRKSDSYPTYYDYLMSVVTNKMVPPYNRAGSKRTERPRDYICPFHRERSRPTDYIFTNDSRRQTNMELDVNLTRPTKYFLYNIDKFDRAIYNATFTKLSTMSFTQSGMLLYLILAALSSTVDAETRTEIEEQCSLPSEEEKNIMLKHVIDSLPMTSADFKFRWAARLVLQPGMAVKPEFLQEAPPLRLRVHQYNLTDSPEEKTSLLNEMVEMDSGGALRDTFEVEEVSEGAGGALLSTLYVRASWRAAPTLLNGTHAFRDPSASLTPRPTGASARRVRMLRVNDRAHYARIHEWGAEAVEIQYATPGLSLLLVIPREASLASVAQRLATDGVVAATERLRPLRLAVTMPLYTLRMTLLLPNKFKSMGISRLVSEPTAGEDPRIWLSHAVQRVMFWSEAGRHAFKDDGIQWDEVPDKEIILDCPYVFFVRWKNVTLLTGNFLL